MIVTYNPKKLCAQDGASAEAERLQKEQQLRERKASKERRRQQARQKVEAS